MEGAPLPLEQRGKGAVRHNVDDRIQGKLGNLRLAHVQKMKVPVWRESPVTMRLIRDKAKVKGVKSYALPRELFGSNFEGS
jgi:hypothetical protein